MPIPALDVPQSLSIVTDLDIKERGYRALGDIVRYTPGVNSSQGEGHRDAIVFRGNRSTADFYIDGVRDDVQYYRGFTIWNRLKCCAGQMRCCSGVAARAAR